MRWFWCGNFAIVSLHDCSPCEARYAGSARGRNAQVPSEELANNTSTSMKIIMGMVRAELPLYVHLDRIQVRIICTHQQHHQVLVGGNG